MRKKVRYILRDYSNLIRRLQQLDLPHKIIGAVDDNPIYLFKLQSQSCNPKQILITGGVHGDEPAGVEAAIKFLTRDNNELLNHFTFVVIPCINPYGYINDTRENRNKVDINRSFEKDDVLETEIVKGAISNMKFAMTIDFHEDYEAKGFYLYEGIQNEEYLGPQITNVVKSIGPIDTEDSGEDTTAITQGVYKVASKWGAQGLAPYLLHYHSDHVIIPETPTVLELDQRVALHLGILDTALTHYVEEK